MTRFRAVFFDVGETLVDETSLWAARADAFGIPRFTFFGVFGALIDRGEDHRRIYDVFGIEPGSGKAEFGLDDFYPDAVPCLRELRSRGLRLGLVGNTSEDIEDVLRTLDLPVDVIGSSARWGVEKPAPAFFARVVEEAGCEAREVAYVGDRLDNDVLPALDAGMAGIFLRRGPWGWLHASKPGAERATARIDTLNELPALLDVL